VAVRRYSSHAIHRPHHALRIIEAKIVVTLQWRCIQICAFIRILKYYLIKAILFEDKWDRMIVLKKLFLASPVQHYELRLDS
jgi:hypothetical protein